MFLNKIREWHAKKIQEIQKIFGLTNYQILWITFFEGAMVGIILGYYFFD
tara:strand:- start:44 stop:193 length:150 start_codon:yes stop_codon:yes gene_type:complete